MSKMDLRQIGTIFGHPIYVDLADLIDYKGEDELLSSRDIEEMKVAKTMAKVFGITPKVDEASINELDTNKEVKI